ncbi:MAG: zinc-ribbon domain-containing protein, partial [Candidatus Odinarchaeota archaeon]
MYCQNCGEKLEMENQRFCQNCGSEILSTDETPKPISWEEQNKPTTQSIPIPQYETSFKKGGQAGSYSKRAFAFAFISLVIACIGFSLEFFAYIKFMAPTYIYPRIPNGPIL